jgi:hypothetical protein
VTGMVASNVSLSKSGSGSALDLFFPVSLSSKEEATVNKIYYPKDGGANPYLPLMTSIANISSALNAVNYVLYALYNNSAAIHEQPDPMVKEMRIRGIVAGVLNAMPANLVKPVKSGESSVLDGYVSGAQTGFYIEAVEKGFDLVFGGLPPQGSGGGTLMSPKPLPESVYQTKFAQEDYSLNNYTDLRRAPREVPVDPGSFSRVGYNFGDTSQAEDIKKRLYENPVALECLSEMRHLNSQLLGDSPSIESAHKRKISALGLGASWRFIYDISIAGIKLFDNDNDPFPEKVSQDIKVLSKFVSFLIVREPAVAALNAHVRNMRENETRKKSGLGEQPPVANDAVVTPQSLVFAQKLACTFKVHLPEKLARYITQQAEGDISYSSLYLWASGWAQAAVKRPGSRGQGTQFKNLSHYALPASATEKLVEFRNQVGYSTESGRTDKNGLFINRAGGLHYLPSDESYTVENAKARETLLDTALRSAYDLGAPISNPKVLQIFQATMGETGKAHDAETYTKAYEDLKGYSGTMMAYNWDFGYMITAQADRPEASSIARLSHSAKPDALAIKTFLVRPFGQAMKQLVASDLTEFQTNNARREAAGFDPSFLGSWNNNFDAVFKLYDYLWGRGQVPDFKGLIQEAAKSMGISSLEDDKVVNYERKLYASVLSPTFEVKDLPGGKPTPASYVRLCLRDALIDAGAQNRWGQPNNLYNVVSKDPTGDPADDPHYFTSSMSLSEFSRVYTYFGGRLFYHMCNHLTKVDPKALMLRNYGEEQDIGDDAPPHVRDGLAFREISSTAMPMAIAFAKYVPSSSSILEAANKEALSIKENPSIDEDSLKVPGSRGPRDEGDDGFYFLPHQMRAHRVLRNHPKFAVLDVSPGGGKTVIILTDIMACKQEFGGDKIKPLVIVPSALLPGWANDANDTITDNKWNMVSLISSTKAAWGDDRLDEVIENAPPNTIFLCSYDLLSRTASDKFTIADQSMTISPATEFIKKHQFNYVAIDESHKVKNSSSNVHERVKDVVAASTVEYVRLMSGTVVSNDLVDIIGQAQLKGSHIYRTNGEFFEEYGEYDEHGRFVGWKKNAPESIKQKFREFAAFITFKRRDWAFLLPYPVETFHPVAFEELDENGDPVNKFDALHRKAYEDVLEEAAEEIIKYLRDKQARKKLEKEDDDEAEEEMDESLESNEWITRLERLLTDPFNDPVAAEIFNRDPEFRAYRDSGKSYVPNKIRQTVKIIKGHFDRNEWKKGGTYNPGTVVDHGEDQYVLRKYPRYKDGTEGQSKIENYVSNTPPAEDRENWKVEPRGKVLVVCKYKRTVQSVYDSLPSNLKKVAGMYSGNIAKGEKDANIASFKKPDSPMKILIALEAAGSMEGHNIQAASRLVRVEIPWAPGDIEQTTARIFRPSPKNFEDGEMLRSIIYLDWVISDDSIEVAKYGRVVSKMVVTRMFAEMDNPDYSDVLRSCKRATPDLAYSDSDPYTLRPIRMGHDNLLRIRKFPTGDEINSVLYGSPVDFNTNVPREDEGTLDPGYLSGYFKIQQQEEAEFDRMRREGESRFYKIEPTEELPGAKLLERVPIAPHQNLPDVHGYDIERILDWVGDKEQKHVMDSLRNMDGTWDEKNDPLSGLPVITPFGRGVIDRGFFRKRTKAAGPYSFDEDHPFVRVRVKLSQPQGSDEVMESLDPSMVWVATSVPDEDRKLFEVDNKAKEIKVTDRDRKLSGRVDELDSDVERQSGNILIEDDELHPTDTIDNNILVVYPVVYNDMLMLEVAVDDPDSAELKDFGFKHYGDYALAFAEREKYAYAVVDYLQSFFTLTDMSKKRIMTSLDSFESVRTRKFKMELAPIKDMQMFFRIQHKRVPKDKLNVVPLVVGGVNQLAFAIDLRTNPQVRPLLNKVIPGTAGARLSKADGMWMKFARNKADAKRALNELKQSGYVIENEKEFNEMLRQLTLIPAKRR